MSMTKQQLMDSLTQEQRNAIGTIIRGKDPEGDYAGTDEDGNTLWQEDTEATLNDLALWFETYDPASALEH
jgi:hypothetical protein